MCVDPITAIGMGIWAAGAGMQTMQQAGAYKAQAKAHEIQEDRTRDAGAYAAARQTEQVQSMIGSGVAAAGANGLRLQGTTAKAVRDIGREGAMDVAATRLNTRMDVESERIAASVARTNAKNTMAGLPFAVAAPIIGGLSNSQAVKNWWNKPSAATRATTIGSTPWNIRSAYG